MLVYPNIAYVYNANTEPNRINFLTLQIGKHTRLADSLTNYNGYNMPLVTAILQYRERALPEILNLLAVINDEKAISEGIYIINRMIDAGN